MRRGGALLGWLFLAVAACGVALRAVYYFGGAR